MDYQPIIDNQRSYFLSGEPQKLSNRRKNLELLKSILQTNGDRLAEAVQKDLRRTPKTTFAVEINSLLHEIDYFLDNFENWAANQQVEKQRKNENDECFIKKQPRGVILVLSPWNYTISMVFLPIIPAIAAGNTVVLKPSEYSSATSELIESLFRQHFDERLIKVIQGGVRESTALLKLRFDYIFYTGSAEVGKVIMKDAAHFLTPVTLECGGKCPVFIDNDVDMALTAKRIVWGKWLNVGQTCLAPDFILTTQETKSKLVPELVRALKDSFGSDAKSSEEYSRIINSYHWNRLNSLLQKSSGKVLFQGGQSDESDLFIPPMIMDISFNDSLMMEEIFGPILPIITIKNLGEAIEFIQKGEKPLASYIFSKSDASIQRFLREVVSGGCTVNDVLMHSTIVTLPFGGVGNSGMGRYRGKFGFDTFTHEKAVLERQFSN